MKLNLFKSEVEKLFPRYPISFCNRQTQESASISDIIKKNVPDLDHGSWYAINPLLPGGHLQTAYTALNKFESVDLVHYKRRILQVDLVNKYYTVDGEQLRYDQWEGKSTFAVDYVFSGKPNPNHEQFKPESQTKELPPRTEYVDPAEEQKLLLDESKPLLIALHGLSGGSYESYIRAFVSRITQDPYNFDALVLNARGCANHTITSPQLFNGLWTNDLRYFINEHVKKLWPNKRIYLIGFSLGGAITANYLGQEADNVYENIKGAAIMGSPWDFNESSIQLSESMFGNLVYSPTMCQNLVRLLKEHSAGYLKHHEIVENYISNPSNFTLNKLRDFDDEFTSKLFGFNCADEYYRHASPIQRLLKVRVPTIILNSKDDPIVGNRTLPYSEVVLNPFTVMVTTSQGGHLGWFTCYGKRWYVEPICKLFSQLDKNWVIETVEKSSLPKDINGIWKHDRIVN